MDTLGFLSTVRAADSIAASYPAAQYHLTLQDLFNTSNTNTWPQAYYVNDTFWDRSNPKAPIFLCVGGEGPPIDGSAVVDSVHCNVAVEFLQASGALMFAVEHRYYGCHNASACPVDPMREDNHDPSFLRYLSSRQALGDLSIFHGNMESKYGLTPHNRWITFGGSYPGMLASFARLKYPLLFYASVSSSAPVEAELNMVGYNNGESRAKGEPNGGCMQA